MRVAFHLLVIATILTACGQMPVGTLSMRDHRSVREDRAVIFGSVVVVQNDDARSEGIYLVAPDVSPEATIDGIAYEQRAFVPEQGGYFFALVEPGRYRAHAMRVDETSLWIFGIEIDPDAFYFAPQVMIDVPEPRTAYYVGTLRIEFRVDPDNPPDGLQLVSVNVENAAAAARARFSNLYAHLAIPVVDRIMVAHGDAEPRIAHARKVPDGPDIPTPVIPNMPTLILPAF